MGRNGTEPIGSEENDDSINQNKKTKNGRTLRHDFSAKKASTYSHIQNETKRLGEQIVARVLRAVRFYPRVIWKHSNKLPLCNAERNMEIKSRETEREGSCKIGSDGIREHKILPSKSVPCTGCKLRSVAIGTIVDGYCTQYTF